MNYMGRYDRYNNYGMNQGYGMSSSQDYYNNNYGSGNNYYTQNRWQGFGSNFNRQPLMRGDNPIITIIVGIAKLIGGLISIVGGLLGHTGDLLINRKPIARAIKSRVEQKSQEISNYWNALVSGEGTEDQLLKESTRIDKDIDNISNDIEETKTKGNELNKQKQDVGRFIVKANDVKENVEAVVNNKKQDNDGKIRQEYIDVTQDESTSKYEAMLAVILQKIDQKGNEYIKLQNQIEELRKEYSELKQIKASMQDFKEKIDNNIMNGNYVKEIKVPDPTPDYVDSNSEKLLDNTHNVQTSNVEESKQVEEHSENNTNTNEENTTESHELEVSNSTVKEQDNGENETNDSTTKQEETNEEPNKVEEVDEPSNDAENELSKLAPKETGETEKSDKPIIEAPLEKDDATENELRTLATGNNQ